MRRIRARAGLLIIGAVLFIPCPRVAAQQGEIVFDISVARHSNVPTDGGAASKMSAATTYFKTLDGSSCSPGDVQCCIALSKFGGTATWSNSGEDEIDTPSEATTVLNRTVAQVKIVTVIHACTFLGEEADACAYKGGSPRSAIIIEGTPRADVWAHEFGVMRGMDDTYGAGCDRYVMHAPPTSNTRNVVTDSHCSTFLYDTSDPSSSPYHVGGVCLASGTVPDPINSYFVPQIGSVTAPCEGSEAGANGCSGAQIGGAIGKFYWCPNNHLTSNTNSARLKIVIRDGSDLPIAGVAAADICMLFNGGTPAQGFSGAGDDSIIANSQYNFDPYCPQVRCVEADGASDANGVAYITFTGANPAAPGVGVRDPLRKWGGYAGDIPVRVLGVNLAGRLTSSDANGTYTAHVKSFDFVGGRDTRVNLGERVNSLDIYPVQSSVNTGIYNYGRDFDNNGAVNVLDYNAIRGHNYHDCDTPLLN